MGKASRRKRNRSYLRPPSMNFGASRSIPMKPELVEAMEQMRLAFVKRFGRDPGPEDPIFFDNDCDIPTPINESIVTQELMEMMAAANIDPSKIYATRKTGFLPCEDNLHLMSESDKKEWNDAVQEYYDRLSHGKPA